MRSLLIFSPVARNCDLCSIRAFGRGTEAPLSSSCYDPATGFDSWLIISAVPSIAIAGALRPLASRVRASPVLAALLVQLRLNLLACVANRWRLRFRVIGAVPCWRPDALDVEERQSPVGLRRKPTPIRAQAGLGIENLHKVLSTLVIDPSEATRIVTLHIRKALFVWQLMSLVGSLCELQSVV
jgi:hypothetical protein